MSNYKLMPVDPTPEMISEGARHLQIMSLPEREAASVFRAMSAVSPVVQREPVGEAGPLPGAKGFTTAVFESAKVPEGTKLYTDPQPAEQQPDSWIRMSEDYVVFSRCNWIYPASTEDSAGPRDEQRFMAVGRRDGDIVLPAPDGELDREDMKTMLTWPSASKPTEHQPTPDVAALVEALEGIMRVEARDRVMPVGAEWDAARAALAAYRKGVQI